jgi:hypothetical protein
LLNPSGRDELAMKYLLRTLSEDERERLEERYFSDDAMLEELEIAEDELVDRYVRGELSETDAGRFQQTIAGSPRLVERVKFAKAFADKLALATIPVTKPEPKESWWQKWFGESRWPQLAPALGLLIVLVGGTVLLVGWLRLKEESRKLAEQQAQLEQRQREIERQAAELKAQADELAKRGSQPSPNEPLPQQPAPPTTSILASLTLFPGTTRSSGRANTLRVEPTTTEVQLTLNFSDTDYTSYRAVIKKDNVAEIFSRSGLSPRKTNRGGVISLRLPGKQLPAGDYVINLFGGEANEGVADYQFRVVK